MEQTTNIVGFLSALGFAPARQSNGSLYYLSPLHDETDPSFHVTVSRNQWFDFGLGVGGGLAELKRQLIEVGTVIADNISNLPFVMPVVVAQPSVPGVTLTSVGPLADWRLEQYVRQRKVNIAVAKQYCREVHYHFTASGKDGFAIGFPNDSGGYEYRNRLMKGCIGKKDISSFRNPSSLSCCVYEGFMDFLSALTLPLSAGFYAEDSDYVVLNSTITAKRAVEALSEYSSIHLYLDNDPAGDTATRLIMDACPIAVDRRDLFVGKKDINDYLNQNN